MQNGEYKVVDIPPNRTWGKWGELKAQLGNLPDGKALEIPRALSGNDVASLRQFLKREGSPISVRRMGDSTFVWRHK